ncbi:MAG: sugar transferase [Phycisphaerae bacterium]|jgi:lipopolysaccharide/colanic/teichoic acid biosynthesis glycosyltransferase|nr:sugar transferase [Phycisphaerae bacterium]
MRQRFFDLLCAIPMTLIALLPMGLIAMAIVLTDGLPVLFRQTRVGRHGREFTLLKFRSMRGAPKGASGGFEPGQTSRVTGVGRLLRRTKLDELPQLFNVLRGDMSVVGPRPEVPRWTSVHGEMWKVVLSVRPGLTDPASLAFSDEESILAAAEDPEAAYRDEVLPRKLRLAMEYARTRTVAGDVGIIVATAGLVLRRLAGR